MLFDFIREEIKDQYLLDDRPWIIGYSGGKDSTALLQMVWYALRELKANGKLKKEIHVVSNDTLVENPKIVNWVETNLKLIQKQAELERFPMTVAITYPEINDSYWVNLIGKGYPTPNSSFRWCTDRLKIRPTSNYIKKQVAEKGEVVILLGTRRGESQNRNQTFNKYAMKGVRLRRHVDLDLAYVYSPLEFVQTDDLWQYLLQVPSPWAGSNRPLVTMYRNAAGGDCPLVIDDSTPSCGQSRFGCWVCTVVTKDKSMEAMVDNGEEHLEPLLDLRNWINDTRNDESNRMMRLRTGGSGKGPYNFRMRAEILTKLLKAQQESGETLITMPELRAIQMIWDKDGSYYNVANIYNSIYNSDLVIDTDMMKSNAEKVKEDHLSMVKELCEKHETDYEQLAKWIEEERRRIHQTTRKSIIDDIEERSLNLTS
jgi:DNA sulfur modification protein DndC